MKQRRIIFFILTIAWMVCIFMFSAEEGTGSTEMSHYAGRIVGKIFVPHYEEWEPETQEEFAARIDYPVRKTGHATEYALLALLLAGSLVEIKEGDDKKVLVKKLGISFAISVLYASSDEFHQLFVEGRSGRITDVLIDSSGALLATIILFCIITLVKINKEAKKTKENM